MFRKRIDIFSAGVIRTLLRDASFTYHAVSDFKVFFLKHCRDLRVWVAKSIELLECWATLPFYR